MFLHCGNTIINLDKVETINFEGDSIDFVFDVDETIDKIMYPKCFTVFEYELGGESATDAYKTILKRLDNSKQLIDLDSTTKYGGLDDETFQERAIETLKAIISKVEEETNKTQEE